MPVDPTFNYNDEGDALFGMIEDIRFVGFAGGGFQMIANGRVSTASGSITGAKLYEKTSQDDDLDENGTGDLVDAFNAAEAVHSLGITPIQLRDFLLTMAQEAVKHKAAHD